MTELNRRSFVRAAGVAGAGAAFAGPAGARTVADALDTDGGRQEVVVVFRDTDDQSVLDEFDLPVGRFDYGVLPMSWTELDGDGIADLAGREEVRYVSDTFELEYYNDVESRESMHVEAVNAAADFASAEFNGEGIDTVVIDSGIDGAHPDFQGRIVGNYEYVDEPFGDRDPEMWVDIGPGDSDDIGHGQHCCGTVAGDGFASKTEGTGPYVGMAPAARLSAYSVSQAVYLPYAVGAWDHMLARKRDESDDFDPVVCSNSYGVARGNRYNPLDPLNVATWEAFQEGILPVFALGNSGPSEGTASRYAKAPHVLGVAASRKDETVTEFSSRGRSVGTELPNAEETVSPAHHDRQSLLENMEGFHALTRDGRLIVDRGTLSGTLGPGVKDPAGGTGVDQDSGVVTHHLKMPDGDEDLLAGTLSLTPDGQQVTVSFYTDYGEPDEELLARMGEEPVKVHEDIALDVPGGEPVTVEFDPQVTAALRYEFDYRVYDLIESDGDSFEQTSLDSFRPLTLYRPGILTHGNSVMSTFDPEDALAPLSTGDGEPFYGRISGTSMACPAAAGIAALVIEAGRSHTTDAAPDGLAFVGHEDAGEPGTFGPMDVIRTIEATANHDADGYTVANAGPGHVNAAAAVERARYGAFATPSEAHDSLVSGTGDGGDGGDGDATVTAGGSRADDGQVFTAGGTNQVDITVANPSADVTVYDEIPSSWSVVSGESTQSTDDGRQRVELGTVPSGETRTLTYFVEAPDGPAATNQYTFGPATAETEAATTQVAGTETNYVVGVGTSPSL
ncbi:S8 family peptidase [Haloglomus salinum]|uniref:S8 family peptidase n=1 Tax=Haloglomus salinum TaxID=2962673 RepID=UPI0020C96E44|nr:S8 family serine peptidase [Haloglomus salinum]